MTSLKLIERNVPKDKIAMLSIPMIPVKIIITIFLTRYLVGYKIEIMNIFPIYSTNSENLIQVHCGTSANERVPNQLPSSSHPLSSPRPPCLRHSHVSHCIQMIITVAVILIFGNIIHSNLLKDSIFPVSYYVLLCSSITITITIILIHITIMVHQVLSWRRGRLPSELLCSCHWSSCLPQGWHLCNVRFGEDYW